MSFIPKPHEIYKHFKGNLYQITAIAEHSETGEQLVIYQALYGDFKTYARPLELFVDKVNREKYPDVSQEYRFELQGSDSERQKARTQEAPMQEQAADIPQAGMTKQAEETASGLDPLLEEFLDADTYEQRLNILAGLHHKLTDEMLTTMALACDIELKEGELEERYAELRGCLITLEHYECNRLR
ncbi:MAG: DUF1653 domain-containing protein [Roseburia sp.]|nr:DUF1653 domain-containing protein [Roseburia sp.]